METVGLPTQPLTIPGRRRQVVVVLIAALALWLVVGFARGPQLAQARFTALEEPKPVDQLETTSLPAIPPLFVVQVQSQVSLGDRMWYGASRVYLVEPVTGWSLDLSGLGLAPSAMVPGPPTSALTPRDIR